MNGCKPKWIPGFNSSPIVAPPIAPPGDKSPATPNVAGATPNVAPAAGDLSPDSPPCSTPVAFTWPATLRLVSLRLATTDLPGYLFRNHPHGPRGPLLPPFAPVAITLPAILGPIHGSTGEPTTTAYYAVTPAVAAILCSMVESKWPDFFTSVDPQCAAAKAALMDIWEWIGANYDATAIREGIAAARLGAGQPRDSIFLPVSGPIGA